MTLSEEPSRRDYDWNEGWAHVPDADLARAGWAHHGIAVSRAGEVYTGHPAKPLMVVMDRQGALLSSWPTDLTDLHGITIVEEQGTEYLWLADCGAKQYPETGYEYRPGEFPGRVVKTTLDGNVVMELERPDLPRYREMPFSPTGVAVHEERLGGNGDIWVTDGYGAFYVHRYDRAGRYLGSISGEEGAGDFVEPHGIFIDYRKEEPELYVADRENHRVQVYDLEFGFKRVFGADYLRMPSAFATSGDLMVIAELFARLTILDRDDRLVCHVGANDAVWEADGWPNSLDQDGNSIRSPLLESGKFNSPHGLAVDADGNLYVAEWLIGGRLVKLAPR